MVYCSVIHLQYINSLKYHRYPGHVRKPLRLLTGHSLKARV